MLPTPDTSHVSFDTIYEPSEDSYLFLDTLSSTSESKWLSERFQKDAGTSNPVPLVVEAGTGSGVVLAFVAAQSQAIFGRRDILTLGTDVNRNACLATQETVSTALKAPPGNPETASASHLQTVHISSLTADLCSSLRPSSVDVLLFNPPYVPSEELPALPTAAQNDTATAQAMSRSAKFESDSYFLSLTYAGGADGLETTNRLLDAIPGILSPRGVAYVLLCKQNRPDEVKERIRGWGRWNAETVGSSGMQAGWEKLVIVRIWRADGL